MTPPATRDEVVEMMARRRCERKNLAWNDAPEPVRKFFVASAIADLTALEAAGVRLVPAEATEEMMRAAAGQRGFAWSQAVNLAIAASPYNKEPDNG